MEHALCVHSSLSMLRLWFLFYTVWLALTQFSVHCQCKPFRCSLGVWLISPLIILRTCLWSSCGGNLLNGEKLSFISSYFSYAFAFSCLCICVSCVEMLFHCFCRTMVHACAILTKVCLGCYDNCHYLLLTNKICFLVDLLVDHLNVSSYACALVSYLYNKWLRHIRGQSVASHVYENSN